MRYKFVTFRSSFFANLFFGSAKCSDRTLMGVYLAKFQPQIGLGQRQIGLQYNVKKILSANIIAKEGGCRAMGRRGHG